MHSLLAVSPTQEVGPNRLDCDKRWENLLQLWRNTDKHVRRLIAHAQGGQPDGYQMGGKVLKKLQSEWNSLTMQEHHCNSQVCEEEDGKMLEITKRNLSRISQETSLQEEQTSQEEERTDREYTEWKDWKIREATRQTIRLGRLEESKRKEEYWALYKECNSIMEGNRKTWLERKEAENLRRLEEEKMDRLEMARLKKTKSRNNAGEEEIQDSHVKKKKETKEDYTRRMEEKKRLEGKQKMKSDLWKQRREKDGRLVCVWKSVKQKEEDDETNKEQRHSSLQEGTEDPWLEEIVLTQTERKKLSELEQWYSRTELNPTSNSIPSTQRRNQPPGRPIQPTGRSNQQEHSLLEMQNTQAKPDNKPEPDKCETSEKMCNTVSQDGTPPSRCIPDRSLDSSKPSGTVTQQVARIAPTTPTPPVHPTHPVQIAAKPAQSAKM